MKIAIFFERDGILNLPKVERQYQVPPLTLADFHVNEAALPACEALKAAGFTLIATSNQPGLSQGTVSRRELDRMNMLLRQTFPLDDILVCPHDPADNCSCRKPLPGLFMEAAFKHHLDLERSFVISDKWPDARAARSVGATSMLLQSPWVGSGHHDFVLSSISAIAGKILQLQTRHLAA
ncbi:MAG TPA: HAD-IIIA family hydrolase [Verrucomicrobiae bacterium]|jgi:D-glycero-D-manno-heptose 1,7-bisphosphate phosphatase|nr:HAD-IIIA family hydrolase [Verrucomicrobiae bacterium]